MRIFCPAMVADSPSLFSVLQVRARGSVENRSKLRAGPRSRGPPGAVLLDDLGDSTRTHGATTLTDGEAQALLHGDRLDQLDRHFGVVARHDHLRALGEGHDAGHVGGAEVELRAVVVEERRVPTALVLGQDVDLRLEPGVRGDRAGLDHDLAALDILTLGAAKEQSDVLAGLAL